MRRGLLTVLIALLMAAPLGAQPVPTSVSGTLSHNGSATLTGSGFGTKSPAAPTVYDDTSGTTITDLWTGAWPNLYAGDDAVNNMAYRTVFHSFAMPHTRISKYMAGCHLDRTGPQAGFNVMVFKAHDPFPAKTFWSFLYAEDPNFTEAAGSAGNNKIYDWSWGTEPYAQENEPDDQDNWYAERKPDGAMVYHLNDDRTSSPRNLDDSVSWWGSAGTDPVGTWVQNEYYVAHTSTSAGRFRALVDGEEVIDYQGHTDNMLGTSRTSAVGGFESQEGANQCRFFAEIYFDHSWAHLMLGNASTYTASTIREMQIPTSWSTTEIGFTVKFNRLADGADKWLYVVDSDGNVNSGGLFLEASGGGGAGTVPVRPTAQPLRRILRVELLGVPLALGFLYMRRSRWSVS